VIDGLEADVVTLAPAYDLKAITEKGNLIPRLAKAVAEQQRVLHLDPSARPTLACVEEGRLPLSNEGFQPDAESLGFVLPHELKIETNLSDGVGLTAKVERVLAFGSATRINLAGASGQSNRFYEVELPRERAAALRLVAGQNMRLKPARIRLFALETQLLVRQPPKGGSIGVDGERI